jgi:hypothetical protein
VSNNLQGIGIALIAIAYAPLIIALFAGNGGGVWKFLAFVLCTIALVTSPLALAGIVPWLLALACAAGAHGAARRERTQAAILDELHEQNRLMRGQPAEPKPPRTLRDRLWQNAKGN